MRNKVLSLMSPRRNSFNLTGQSIWWRHYLLTATLFVGIAASMTPAAYAADAVPGDACSQANWTILSGGPETSGVGYYMTCQGGVWVRITESATNGYLGVKQAAPMAPLHVGGEAIIGSTGLSCSGTTEGGLRYSSGNVQFCNGSIWTNVDGASSCDPVPAAYDFTDQSSVTANTLITSNILSITGTDPGCNAIVSVSGGGSPQFRVCSDSICSSEVQTWTATNTSLDMNARYLQLRATSASTGSTTVNVTASVGGVTNTWSISTASSGSCGASPTIGQVCADGTIYAGLTPDGNKDMYVERCDVTKTWDGSNCTGGTNVFPWNNDNGTGYVLVGVSSLVTGESNTAAIIGSDADSGVAGVQPHQAAQACADSTAHGHTDWYLPAVNETKTIYENLVDATPNDDVFSPIISGFVSARYWTSTEVYDNLYSGNVDFSTGIGHVSGTSGIKDYDYHVRCARTD